MNASSLSPARWRSTPGTVAAAVAAPTIAAVLSLGMTANLLERFGLTYYAALAIVTTLANGGIYAVIAIWPFIAPVAITVKTLMAVFGTAAAVGF
ncbi:MAG: hypothetical protein EOL89_11815 [Actinobacteria bacterium]|nr:hypothetical protein [Actinomycetota bacterium]